MNNLSDFHIHSHFSSDSTASMEEIIKKALSLNLKAICFTDHNDFGYPEENGKIQFQLDLKSYTAEIAALKAHYGKDIDIYTGVEQGLWNKYANEIDGYSRQFAFDFIIGSTHLVEGVDPYYSSFWESHSIRDGLNAYFCSIVDSIQSCHEFDVYGHLDYIVRYIPDKSYLFRYFDFADIIDTALKLLIERGKGIELNTSGIKYGLPYAHPNKDILKRYRELGGEILTIGSDGHIPGHIAYAFEQVENILSTCGFKYYTIFKQRRPEFIKL